jgi:hypothetical protein
MAGDLKALLIKLYKDPKFRRTFADNPNKALAAEGFDTSNLSVPKKVKLADLEEQMLAETPSKDDGRALTLDEISKFSDQRILKHYGSKIQPHDSAINEENPPAFSCAIPTLLHPKYQYHARCGIRGTDRHDCRGGKRPQKAA